MSAPQQSAPVPSRKTQRWWQFGLRSIFIVTCLVALVCGWYTHRYRKLHHAAAVLEQNGVSYFSGRFVYSEPETHPWYNRLPGLDPPPLIVSVWLRSDHDIAAVAPVLADVGTVKRVSIDDLTVPDLKLLSQVESIDSIEAEWGITADQLRPLQSLRLKDFSVTGADVNIPHDALEILYSIPTLKSVGTAHGEGAVPQELRDKRPDISIYITDFPP